MKIVELRTHRRTMALPTPFVTAKRTVTTLRSVFVEVIDDEGRSGWGEVVPNLRDTGESWEGLEPVILGPLRDRVIGADPAAFDKVCRDLEAVVAGNQGARSAVDVAVHDLRARQLGIPLRQLFGGTVDRLDTDVSIPFGPLEAMVAQAVAFRAEGFRAVKIKVGQPGRTDVEVVTEIAAALPADTVIRLDANQGWSAKHAVRCMAELDRAGVDIEVLEQPVPAADVAGLRFVTERVNAAVIADESVASVGDVLDLIRRDAVDGFMLKPSKLGGLRAARRAVALAGSAGKRCMVSTVLESHLGVTAAANLAASAPDVITYVDLDAAVFTGRQGVRGGMTYERGQVVLPAAPGLGVTGIDDAS
ncbi:o-succinylbenzoate synthase [Actinokineospora alba]|uniref:Dipeptide epimerase n=1 Tax=Actinokineospora alba TaxID=504798 RepID=A0A1H0NJN0_9PSEU|nr:dipeptide epimerase [Actinokineospora alba]TDP68736.1 o-succinylbenzoate synthase [Actinokineospora alba]SDH85513.1 o-succinylbenzoate synthase [Actinokineospora alba]SDO92625.1 o-succinylbenzoate synthase [Actinokineospora alba]